MQDLEPERTYKARSRERTGLERGTPIEPHGRKESRRIRQRQPHAHSFAARRPDAPRKRGPPDAAFPQLVLTHRADPPSTRIAHSPGSGTVERIRPHRILPAWPQRGRARSRQPSHAKKHRSRWTAIEQDARPLLERIARSTSRTSSLGNHPSFCPSRSTCCNRRLLMLQQFTYFGIGHCQQRVGLRRFEGSPLLTAPTAPTRSAVSSFRRAPSS